MRSSAAANFVHPRIVSFDGPLSNNGWIAPSSADWAAKSALGLPMAGDVEVFVAASEALEGVLG